jgi:antitoxin HicB
MLWYPVTLKRDRDGRVLVDFPDFPEAHSYGDDEEEALTRARDALATIIDAYIQDRERIPLPSQWPGAPSVRLPALTAAKVHLYRAMQEQRVTKTELARRLHWHLPQVDRLLDVYHDSRFDRLEAAASALGKEFSFVITDESSGIASASGGPRRRSGVRPGAATGMGEVRKFMSTPRKRYRMAGTPPKPAAGKGQRARKGRKK